MDYERIHKIQVGVISPSKLRMKLLGAHNCRKKEERSTSSRASPSKLDVMDYATNSLLNADCDDDEVRDSKDSSILESLSVEKFVGHPQGTRNDSRTNNSNSHEKANINHNRTSQVQDSSDSSIMHPSRYLEEDSNGYESGHGSGSNYSFEFHRGDRVLHHPVAGPFSRQIPSKWNDAEKWIVSRQSTGHPTTSKKVVAQNQGGRKMIFNGPRITPASMTAEQKHSFNQAADTKMPDYSGNISHIFMEKFSFVPHYTKTGSARKAGELSDKSSLTDDCGSTPRLHTQENHKEPPASDAIHTVESVSMRDVGTEMTPVASQDPSRTATPNIATTPLRSPISSMPSSPKNGASSPSCVKATTDAEVISRKNSSQTDLCDKELQLRTRKEIVALGMQLGKMNIASWASKQEVMQDSSLKIIDVDQSLKREFEARAAAWEEAEKSKHMASFRREEIKIQAWENHQKAKFEAKMREVEARIEEMKAHAQEMMVKKLAVTQQQVEDKQATARARMNRHAARTARQVEQIRQTGRTPSASIRCCSWFH